VQVFDAVDLEGMGFQKDLHLMGTSEDQYKSFAFAAVVVVLVGLD
jgi:hypothetical protein